MLYILYIIHNISVQKVGRIKDINFAKVFAILGLVAFMAMMIAKPAYYLDSARKGLYLFANSVLPSLFPFYFCSLLLTYMGAVKGVSMLGAKPVKVLYNTPKESAYIMLLSMLSGYPVGASTCCELYEVGALTTRDVKAISAFASTSGPVFILGTVGGAIFNDTRVGAIILASHYLASMINGLLYRKKKAQDVSTMAHTLDVDNTLSSAITKATTSMLFVGGYIVLCGMIIDTLELVGIRNALTSLVGHDVAQPIVSVIYGLIEMTRGTIESAECTNLLLSIPLATCCITFGGASITMQNYTYLSKCKMKMGEILIRKFTQCIFSTIFAFLLTFSLISEIT